MQCVRKATTEVFGARKIKYNMEQRARGNSVISTQSNTSPGTPRRNVSPPAYVKDESWRHDMLLALQSSANPEPIRVACMKPNVKGPSYFGEVYHGNLTRDEVCELLSGGNGRYLIRESISSPGDFILSFSTAGNILHYKIFYDTTTCKYYSESDDKTYNSLTELMLDILSMLKMINRYNSQMNSHEQQHHQHNVAKRTKQPSFQKPHNFKLHNYKHPKWCDVCHGFMWGLLEQGMKCQDCGLNVHKYCVKDVEVNCGTLTIGHKIDQEPQPRRRSQPSRDDGQPDELLLSLEKKVRCNYQLDCLRYLSFKKYVPVSRFDLESAVNPCYCGNCCHLKDLDTPLCKTGEPSQAYSLPIGWCRFRLNVPAQVYAKVNSWNIAYYSLSRETISLALDQDWHEKQHSQSKIFLKLTPSIICADLDSEKVEFRDPQTDELKIYQLVLQVYVKPGSFVTMGRAGNNEEIDPYFKSSDIYWIIRESDSVIPFGLLAKRVRTLHRKS